MNLVRNLSALSFNGELLAYSSPDGCLKIWETSTKLLKQEYTPSSHLSATCSSLTWGPFENDERTVKKSKKSVETIDSRILNLKLLAMGTTTGEILLYSYTNADLYTYLKNGHTSRVNDIAWFKNNLYSCSNDQHIIIWDIISSTIKTKWKPNLGPIYSICVVSNNNILIASNAIQLWNLKQKSVEKVFTGHGTEVFKLILVNVFEQNLKQYVLSAAVDDRVINAWYLGEKNCKNAVASFVLPDKPANIDILAKKNEPLQVSAVSEDGILSFFEHTLNDKFSKPLQPKFSIQIASKGIDGQKSHPLPILTSNISSGLDSCLLSYGSFLKPTFERIDISDVSNDLFLIKCVTESSFLTEKDVLRIKQAEKPSNVKVLVPGHMTEVGFSESSTRKRKQEQLDIKELPMEERLKALDLSKTPNEMSEEESTLKSNSMIHLLLQGLQSKDNNMLNTVLQNGDDIVIRNTIERLPIQSIFSLLKVLFERLNKKEPKSHPCLKWLTSLISIHIAYFMSCKDISDYLIPFDQLFAARKETVCKMSQAQGILKILLMQAISSSNSSETPSVPLLEYESESSEASDTETDNSDDNIEEEVIQNASSEESSESSDSDSESEMED